MKYLLNVPLSQWDGYSKLNIKQQYEDYSHTAARQETTIEKRSCARGLKSYKILKQ